MNNNYLTEDGQLDFDKLEALNKEDLATAVSSFTNQQQIKWLKHGQQFITQEELDAYAEELINNIFQD